MWCWSRLKSSPDCKEIQPVNPKGNQSWIVIGRTDVEAERPIIWPPDAKYWLIGKYSDAGQDWKWEENGTTEDETVGWHHQLDGHEFKSAPGVGDEQGSLAYCNLWGCKESDTTGRLNWHDCQREETPKQGEARARTLNGNETAQRKNWWLLYTSLAIPFLKCHFNYQWFATVSSLTHAS